MDLLQKARHLLKHYKYSPKKRLGQNFIVDASLLKRIVSYGQVERHDTVLEVGAGLGFLTRVLSRECKRVFAVEIDPRMIEIAKEQLNDLANVSLIEGDIFHLSLPLFNKVISTPPYSISSPLIFWILQKNVKCAVMTLQKEFAERLVASVGGKDYCRLTVNTFCQAKVELLENVHKKHFYPQPAVDSAVVRLRPRARPFLLYDENVFNELLQTLFSQRNKKLRNAIAPFLKKYGIRGRQMIELADLLPFRNERIRRLAPEDFGVLANIIYKDFPLTITKEV